MKPENQLSERSSPKSISFNTDIPKLPSVTEIGVAVLGFTYPSQSA